MNKEVEQNMLKVTFVGEAGTGKTTALSVMTTGNYNKNYKATIGVDFAVLNSQDYQNIKLQIWDVAGGERFSSISRSYYRNAAIFTIFVEINKSFDMQKAEITKWRNEILASMSAVNPVKYIVALSKADEECEVDIEVVSKQLEAWLVTVESNDLKYQGMCHISAKDGITDDLKKLLFQTAEKYLGLQQKHSQDQKLEVFSIATGTSQFFPASYNKLTQDQTTLQNKLIALFNDYTFNWGLHWRHHDHEAQQLVTKFQARTLDSNQSYTILKNMHQKMLGDPNFNKEGSFSRRLQYAMTLSNGEVSKRDSFRGMKL